MRAPAHQRRSPRSLTGSGVLTAAGGAAITTPVFSCLVVGVRWWKGTVREAPGGELCLGRGRSRGQCGVDGARKNPERSQAHEAPLPAHCEVPPFPPPEVAAAALSWSGVPEGAARGLRHPRVHRVYPTARRLERLAGVAALGWNRLVSRFVLDCKVTSTLPGNGAGRV